VTTLLPAGRGKSSERLDGIELLSIGDAPGERILDAIDRVIRDAVEDMAQIQL
jgi:hypothetical protein